MARPASPCRRIVLFVAAVVALVLGPGASPAPAQSKTCPQTTPAYTGPCGPTFELPAWGDAGGWTDPEQYETIQLADVDGDGADELLARTPAGVAIHVFDKTLGQWRPQVDAKDVPAMLTEFASPPPLTTANPSPPATDWTLPQYYDTIQAADIDGQKGEEILGRSASGLIVFKFTPGASPGQGSWSQLTTSGPFTDADGWNTGPFDYATIQTGDIDGNGDAEVIGRNGQGLYAFNWTGSSWKQLALFSDLGDKGGFNDPRYWPSIQLANLDGDLRDELVARDASGLSAYKYRSASWTKISRFYKPFSDNPSGGPDCPFTFPGNTCFGAGPAYYGTIQFADVDGNGRDELLGRASDGLRMLRYRGDTPDAWGRLATLSDLSDANGYTAQQYWETLQFADINGDGRAEALARDKNGLNAWSYDPGSKAWTKLAPSTPLALADDPWGGDRSYYSTIETGDVDGDRRSDVVARGPYGIRTWFYNRRATGGWERFLEGGYPDFPTRACSSGVAPPCGQQAAFNELNQQAHTPTWGLLGPGQDTVRDVWAAASPPSYDELTKLHDGLVRLGNCVNASGSPPQYQTCTPPTAPTFTADEWTKVLNEMFAELYWASGVWSHIYDSATGLAANWQQLVTQQLAQLPAIANELNIGAAGNVQTQLNPREWLSGALSLGATGLALDPATAPIAAILQTAAEVISLIPSASPLFTDPFTGAYNDLQAKFADAASEASKAIREQSQLVRQDANLLRLVGELNQRRTWKLDPAAMASSGGLGFALWVYRELLPALYVRYVISSCQPDSSEFGVERCTAPATDAPGMLGSSTNFTAIGPPPVPNAPFKWGLPCYVNLILREDCTFSALPSNLAKIWAPVSDGCTYDPNDNTKAWTFTCNLGVDPKKSISDSPANDRIWHFPTYTGTPYVDSTSTPRTTGSATTVGVDSTSTSGTAGSATRVRARGVALRLRTRIALPRPVSLRRATVSVERLLHEPAGELVRRRFRRPLRLAGGPLRSDGSRVFASRTRRGPLVRLRLRRVGSGLLSIDMRVRRARVSLPRACSGTRPGVDLATGRIPLNTRLRVRAGRRLRVVSLSPDWRCRRNRVGAVQRLVAARRQVGSPRRSALAVAIRGLRRVRAGRTATFRINVRNPGPTTAYDVLVRAELPPGFRARGTRRTGAQVLWRLARLRPGQSKTMRLRVGIARSARGTKRMAVVTQAIDTRPSRRAVSTRIRR
jgi:uncharacterized repeat protein (TIGR01451 family)